MQEYSRLPAGMKTIFQSMFVASTSIMKVYDATSRNRRAALAKLTSEIERALAE